MATFNKYQTFAGDFANKVHDLLGTGGSTADVLKVLLTNTAPNAATHTVRADTTELSTAGGYTSGGAAATNVGSASGGTLTVVGTDIVFTATTGFGPFQYAVLYNDTPTSPADPLIGWWDYGSAVTLGAGETFTVDFGASLFTVA